MTKKHLLQTCVVALFTIGLIGCASTKTNTQKAEREGFGKEVALEKCMLKAQEAPGKRQWGNGQSFKLGAATSLAELDARAKFARAIAQEIQSTMEDYTNKTEVPGTSDQGGNSNITATGIADALVTNTNIILNSVYQKANGDYNVFVCIEYNGDIANMAADIAKKMNDKLSSAKKNEIKFEQQQFEEKMKSKLEEFNKKMNPQLK